MFFCILQGLLTALMRNKPERKGTSIGGCPQTELIIFHPDNSILL
jgi:hypothetical protein